MKSTKIAALLLTAAATLTATAQTVYRCGNEYSQQPCTGGRALALDESRPTAADAQAAAAQSNRNERLARQMEQDRIAEEKRTGGPTMVVTGVKPVADKPQTPASQSKSGKKERKEPKGPAQFKATAPAKPGDQKAGRKSG